MGRHGECWMCGASEADAGNAEFSEQGRTGGGAGGGDPRRNGQHDVYRDQPELAGAEWLGSVVRDNEEQSSVVEMDNMN